jgi:hypothetical protein
MIPLGTLSRKYKLKLGVIPSDDENQRHRLERWFSAFRCMLFCNTPPSPFLPGWAADNE